jgi:hypothetical protein
MKNTLLVAATMTLGMSISANAATISYSALNDGGTGTNVVGTQPVGVAAGLDAASVYDYFLEPMLANNASGSTVSSSNAAGVSLTAYESTLASAGGAPATALGVDAGSSVVYEASAANGGNGTQQGSAGSSAWGVDTSSVITSASRTVLSFALNNNLLGTFSAVLLDLEGGALNAPDAHVGVYDGVTGNLITSETLSFDSATHGNNAEYLFSFVGLPTASIISFFVGDNDDNGTGGTERIAAADFATFEIAAVPLPMSSLLLGAGLLSFAGFRRRS